MTATHTPELARMVDLAEHVGGVGQTVILTMMNAVVIAASEADRANYADDEDKNPHADEAIARMLELTETFAPIANDKQNHPLCREQFVTATLRILRDAIEANPRVND